MKRFLAVAVMLLVSSRADAQPIPHGGIRQVITDASMSGYGTMVSPLKIRVDCATNDGLKWNGTTWVCSAGATVTGSGTTDTVPLWTSSSAIGNSAITRSSNTYTLSTSDSSFIVTSTAADSNSRLKLVDDVQTWQLAVRGAAGGLGGADQFVIRDETAGADYFQITKATGAVLIPGPATFGDSTSTDGHFVNGSLSLTRAPSASTSTANAVTISEAGTFDTTAGVLISRGANMSVTSTRSVGANDLVNYALELNASGGQQNQALRTGSGDVLLNVTSGNTGIGKAASTTSRLEVAAATGQRAATMINSATSQTASTNNLRSEITGSYDTTSIALQAIAVVGSATSTRSAGANNLENYGGVFTATSAQINRALQTNDGDVILNNNSGNTGVGISPAVKFHVAAGTSSGLATSLTGTVAVVEQANGTADYLQFRSNTTAGLAWAGSGTGGDGRLTYDQSINAMQFATSNTNRGAILSTGKWQFGDTSGSAVDSNVDVVEISNTGTGQTASTALINLAHSGSFDATAANRTGAGINIAISSTRSAGANSLTNKGVTVDVSGGQTNIAFENGNGDNRFNVSGGLSRFDRDVDIGDANTDTLTITSKIDAHVHYTGTAPSISACGTSASVAGNDMRGEITPGTGSPTSCTITFATAWATNKPVCVLQGGASTAAPALTVDDTTDTTKLVINASSALAADTPIYYHCDGRL